MWSVEYKFSSLTCVHVSFPQVQQIEYLEHKDGTPLMESVVKQEPPRGIVSKSFGSSAVSQKMSFAEPFVIFTIFLMQLLVRFYKECVTLFGWTELK